jgi:hypothetical protein
MRCECGVGHERQNLSVPAIQDALRAVANVAGGSMFVALFDRLRSLPKPGDGVTIVPRAEPFGGAVQDLAQPIPGTVPIIDPHKS